MPTVDDALALAGRGYRVVPALGKAPAIRGAHPVGDPLRGKCKGECGRVGHGVLDATTDPDLIREWWGRRYPGANILVPPPGRVVVTDIDPRHGGDVGLAALEAKYGALPATLTTWSGRGDGGRHLWWLHPGGEVSSRQLPAGIDVKTSAGGVIVPPSIHPETGHPYRWELHPIAEAPLWLGRLLRKPTAPAVAPVDARSRRVLPGGQSIAEDFNGATTWAHLLEPLGWRRISGTGDDDGDGWLHPAATSSCSATVRGGRLYVYSTNTPFDVTEAGTPRGYSRFEAYAVLHHGGDMREAARAIRSTGAVA